MALITAPRPANSNSATIPVRSERKNATTVNAAKTENSVSSAGVGRGTDLALIGEGASHGECGAGPGTRRAMTGSHGRQSGRASRRTYARPRQDCNFDGLWPTRKVPIPLPLTSSLRNKGCCGRCWTASNALPHLTSASGAPLRRSRAEPSTICIWTWIPSTRMLGQNEVRTPSHFDHHPRMRVRHGFPSAERSDSTPWQPS